MTPASSTQTKAVHIRYANVQDRLTHMAMAMTMPGEMEVSAAAVYLEKTIVI